jgi:hypothetical protein
VVVVQGKVDARSGGRGSVVTTSDDSEEAAPEPETAEAASIIAEAAWTWDDPECGPVDRRQLVHIDVPGGIEPALVDELGRVLARHPGPDAVMLHFVVSGRQVTVQPGDDYHVAADAGLVGAVDELFGRPVTRLETVRPRVQPNGNGRSRRT